MVEKGGFMTDGEHRFGGDWTEQKLSALRKYLEAYTTALKKRSFQLTYIDGFAGTGYRADKFGSSDPFQGQLIEQERAEQEKWLEGSATIALKTTPGFHRFIFIEKQQKHADALQELKEKYRDKRTIEIIPGEANRELTRICQEENWRNQRAVCFLDPYGMQVEWSTLKAIAATEAIDLWLLVPFGSAVTRLLPHSGKIPEEWQKRLDIFFGTEKWREAIYREPVSKAVQGSLFGGDSMQKTKERQSLENIENYFIERMREIFPLVHQRPLHLKTASNQWLYSFFFAVSSRNKRAQGIAENIAGHIIKKLSE